MLKRIIFTKIKDIQGAFSHDHPWHHCFSSMNHGYLAMIMEWFSNPGILEESWKESPGLFKPWQPKKNHSILQTFSFQVFSISDRKKGIIAQVKTRSILARSEKTETSPSTQSYWFKKYTSIWQFGKVRIKELKIFASSAILQSVCVVIWSNRTVEENMSGEESLFFAIGDFASIFCFISTDNPHWIGCPVIATYVVTITSF